jgi:hypothetical protein
MEEGEGALEGLSEPPKLEYPKTTIGRETSDDDA